MTAPGEPTTAAYGDPYKAIAAAVILQAVRELRVNYYNGYPITQVQKERAREWLRSLDCAFYCEGLDIDHENLLAKLGLA